MNARPEEPWTTAEVLAYRDLVSIQSGQRGQPGSGARLAGVTLGRPLAYRMLPEELPKPWRRRVEDGVGEFLGLFCCVELDEQPRGHSYGTVQLAVALSGPELRATSLRFDDLDDPMPAAEYLRRFAAARPERTARLDSPVPAFDGAGASRPAAVSTSGLLTNEFSWTFAAPDGGRLNERTFAARAVVEVPPNTRALAGKLTCQATVQQHYTRRLARIGSQLRETESFTEPVDGWTPPAVSTGRTTRLLISADAVSYGRDDDIGRTGRTQERLARALERARAATELAVQERQANGDSILFVFPPGIDESATLRRFHRELVQALREINVDLHERAVLRIRVGVERGLCELGAAGWAGRAPIAVTRLRDGRPAKDALAAAPDAHLVLTVSEAVYLDVFTERGVEPAPEAFQRVTVTEKDFTAPAWVHVAE